MESLTAEGCEHHKLSQGFEKKFRHIHTKKKLIQFIPKKCFSRIIKQNKSESQTEETLQHGTFLMLHPMHAFSVTIRDVALHKADIHSGLDQAFLC